MQARTGDDDTSLEARLVPHPACVAGPVSDLTVRFERRGDQLWLRFVVECDVDAIAWPKDADPVRTDGLWAHTCFEVFIATDDGYREVNLSPSGQWASYRFDGYRQGMADAAEGVRIAPLDGATDMVALEAHIDLPPSSRTMGLSAVIETREGAKTYWALTHAADTPDFHHPSSFVLDLPEPA